MNVACIKCELLYGTILLNRHIWDQSTTGLVEKVGKNLLNCTAQHRSFGIDYHLKEFIIIYLFYIHK
jgi:hypothetical protein